MLRGSQISCAERRSRHRALRSASLWLLAVCAAGCGDDAADAQGAMSPVIRADAAADGGADLGHDGGADGGDAGGGCTDREDGTECGDGLHCIDQRCVANRCGDGIVAGLEECDDGNEALGDDCTPGCKRVTPRCGDGNVDEGEECDDANWFEGDGCTSMCEIRLCGDERVEDDEECDDGNDTDDDACSNACRLNKCRNGRLDPGEECDDGNRENDDGCTNTCIAVVCGDGEAEYTEECDDGNAADDDACSNACTANVCGNARIDPGEACDGDSVLGPCLDQCQRIGDNACGECEESSCRDYQGQGVDLIAGCFENADPEWNQRCIDVVNCARAQGCGYAGDSVSRLEPCYCGTATSSDCRMGTGVNGPCKLVIEAAAGSDRSSFIATNITNLSLPLGIAEYLLNCDLESCASDCVH